MARWPLGVMIGVRKVMEGKLTPLREAGFTTLQTAMPPAEFLADPGRCDLRKAIAAAGFTVTSVAAVFPGESYADVEAVRRTVGLLPAETRAERVADTLRCGEFAQALGAGNVSSHIGYIPEDRSDPEYAALVAVVQEICDGLRGSALSFNLETGQEAAENLREFIGEVNRGNLGVNFDPANMILYGTGDPIDALTTLGPWVRGVHCKDGAWPKAAGQLGEEKRLGDGDVGIERFLATLVKIGYEGPLTVEREVPGEQQITDFVYAAGVLRRIAEGL